MLPKVLFGKTAFVKFKISKHFRQNISETDLKQPKIQEKNPRTKSLETLAKFLWFPIKNP